MVSPELMKSVVHFKPEPSLRYWDSPDGTRGWVYCEANNELFLLNESRQGKPYYKVEKRNFPCEGRHIRFVIEEPVHIIFSYDYMNTLVWNGTVSKDRIKCDHMRGQPFVPDTDPNFDRLLDKIFFETEFFTHNDIEWYGENWI